MTTATVDLPTTPCRRCDCGTVTQTVMEGLTFDERRAMKAAGIRRVSGRGLCSRCHQYLRTHGELDSFAPNNRRGERPASTWTCCRRCGLLDPGGELCRDCLDVTYDLNERPTWETTCQT